MNGRRTTAAAAGTVDVGGDLTVNRLGYGAMRITGPGIWGDPPDPDRARAALRRAVWLLARSPQMLPIPGSGSPEHVEQNVAAAGIELSPDEFTAITKGA
jgi:pyridoxine 4-dehydrogenase